MASSLFHPSNPAGTGKGYNGFILDPNRLLAMCGSELHSITIGGDVHLVLENGRIPAQSDVLTCASPVFKAILDPNFSEGQAPRSTRNPKIIPLEDYDIESMTIICILLHKNLSTVHLNTSEKLAETTDPTRILGVAVLADKYALVDHLENELGLKLLAPFTRKHEALHIEDQHNFVRAQINAAVDYVSARTCYMCGTEKYDSNFADTIAQHLEPKKDHWPPDHVKCHTLRGALVAFGSMPEYTAFKDDAYALCTRHSNQSFTRAKFFEATAEDISKSAEVLCHTCTREDRHYAQCKHQEKLRLRMQELDPLFSSSACDVSL